MAFLIGMSEAIKGQKFEIERDRTTIGRNQNNIIVLNDGAISSQHCYISHRGGRYILHDLNSTNGTKVNSEVVKEAELKPKQVIQVGALELMFDNDAPDSSIVTSAIAPKVVIESGPATITPGSFSSVSPFGRRRQDDKVLWLVIIIVVAVLALIGLALFVHKLLS